MKLAAGPLRKCLTLSFCILGLGQCLPAHAFPSLSSDAQLIEGRPYRSFKTRLLILRFPEAREQEARLLMTELDTRLQAVEKELKQNFTTPFKVFVTDRNFGNAFYTGSDIAVDPHVIEPFRLSGASVGDDFTLRAGLDETAYDILVHELTHHAQGAMGKAWLEVVFGDSFDIDGIISPGWLWEGWAVHNESQGLPYKGRAKDSYFTAFIRSGLNGEKATSYAFSANSIEWSFEGYHYVFGAAFQSFLARKYGEAALNDFVISTTGFHGRSDYQRAFGKSFDVLLDEFNAELVSEPMPKVPTTQKDIWDGRSGRVGSFERFPDGSFAFWAAFMGDEPSLIHVGADGKVLSRKYWVSPLKDFTTPRPALPYDAVALDDNKSLLLLSTTDLADGLSNEGGIWSYNVETGDRKKILSVPDALSMTSKGNGDKIWVLEADNSAVRKYILKEWDAKTGTGKVVAQLSNYMSIAQIRISPNGEQLAFSASEHGKSWNIYVLDLKTQKVSTAFASPAQDIHPRWSTKGDRIYFISDLTHKFQVHSVAFPLASGNETQVCQNSQAQWYTSDYALSDAGSMLRVDRSGHFFKVVSDTAQPVCAKLAQVETGPNRPEPSPFAGQAERENPWSVLLPKTRVIYPAYARGAGFSYAAVLAGQSPYQAWSWAAVANWSQKTPSSYVAGLGINTTSLHPFHTTIAASSMHSFLGLKAKDRYLVDLVRLTIPAWSHSFSFEGLNYNRITGSSAFSHAFGLGIAHSFSSSGQTHKSVEPHRGFALTEGYSTFPKSLSNAGITTGVFNAVQTVYLPLTLMPYHTFYLSSREIFTQNRGAGAEGEASDWGFNAESASTTGGAIGPMVGAGVTVRTLGDDFVQSKNLFVERAGYTIPLRFLDMGRMNVLDRTWLNMSLQDFEVGPYFNAIAAPNPTDLSAKFGSQTWHNQVGVQASFDASIIEAIPFINNEFFVYKRLTDDKTWNFQWFIDAKLVY